MLKPEYDKIKNNNELEYVSVKPKNNAFKMPKIMIEPEFLMVERLFCKKLKNQTALEFQNQLKNRFEIIGDDALGGLILIDNATNKIIYWDLLSAYHEKADVDNISTKNTFCISKSLNDFLNNIVEI